MGLSLTIIISLTLSMQSPEIFTDLDCGSCHYPNQWKPLSTNRSFTHDATNFPLIGAHKTANCIQCHEGNTVEEMHDFKQADAECNYCHMDIHFEGYGDNCYRCHNTSNWDFLSWRFRHDETLFPLIGRHSNIACENCHSNAYGFVVLNRTTSCVVCHRDVYTSQVIENGHTENEDCFLCHNTRAWFPSDMSHHDVFFPIFTGNHRKGVWSTCEAECHINPNNYTDFSCGLNGVCHEHRKSKMDDKHDEKNDYRYESRACYNCHPSGREG